MKTVQASAPGKLMLFGEHAVVYGHPCIVTAVDQRVYVTVQKSENATFSVDAPDLKVESYVKPLNILGTGDIPKSVVFLERCYVRFLEKYPQTGGIQVSTKSDFSAKFGFGSSSAVTVAFAKALSTLYGIPLENKQLFALCYQAVLDVQGVGSGFDIASAIWGGTIYYVKPAKIVEILTEKPLPLVVGYTGIKADTATIVKQVEMKKNADEEHVENIFQDIEKLVDIARKEIEQERWDIVGTLMNENEELLEKLGVNTPELDLMIHSARKHAALGAKLSGAGGGDCMIALTQSNTKKKVDDALMQTCAGTIPITTSAPGVRLEKEVELRT